MIEDQHAYVVLPAYPRKLADGAAGRDGQSPDQNPRGEKADVPTLYRADNWPAADCPAVAGAIDEQTNDASVYLTDEVFLYRVVGLTNSELGDIVELEDCYWLDVVQVPARDLHTRGLRVVTPTGVDGWAAARRQACSAEVCGARLLSSPSSGVLAGKLRNLAVVAALTFLIVLMVLVASAGTGLARRAGAGHTPVQLFLMLTGSPDHLLSRGAWLADRCGRKHTNAGWTPAGRRRAAGTALNGGVWTSKSGL